MGNQIGNYLARYDVENDPYAQLVYCRCPQSKKYYNVKVATYRCQTSNDVPCQYRELRPYFYYFEEAGQTKIVKYIACDSCIKDNVKDRFTYHPLGWKENRRYPIPYEDIVIRKFIT